MARMKTPTSSACPAGGQAPHEPDDWGVPDWENAAAYPRYSGATAPMSWAWEFLRRNHDYRRFWADEVMPFVMPDGSVDCDASVGKYKSEEVDGKWSEWGVNQEAIRRFGLLLWPQDPRSGPTGWPLIKGNEIYEFGNSLYQHEVTIETSREKVGYIFDLTRPLEPQFEQALQAARRKQAYRIQCGHLKKKFVRLQTSLYPAYLRLLDAEDADVDRRQIEAALFPDIDNDYETGRRRSATFTDARRAAHKLRDSGYRALAGVQAK